MRYLLAALRVPSTVTRIDDLVAEILVVLVTSGENDRIRTLSLATRDAGDQGPVYVSLRQLGSRRKAAAFRIPWYVTKHPFGHAFSSLWSIVFLPTMVPPIRIRRFSEAVEEGLWHHWRLVLWKRFLSEDSQDQCTTRDNPATALQRAWAESGSMSGQEFEHFMADLLRAAVYAGARHYAARDAWVVAPEGFTKSAIELAKSTGVRLMGRKGIDGLLQDV